MFLVAVDAYSKWPEVKVLSTTTVSKTLNVLREWFATHGIPEHLVTDNGPQFVAEEFDVFTKHNGIKHTKSAPYHPASNGLAERFIKSMKQSLKASANDGRSLIQRLSSYLLTYRTTAHSTTGVPPCKLLTGRDLRTRLSLIQPSREKTVFDRQARQKASHDRRSRHREWIDGDRVLARNLRDGPDWIPATIVEVLGPVTYIVETESGQRWKRHADQLKDWLLPIVPERGNADSSRGPDTDVVDPELEEPGESQPENSDTDRESPPEDEREDSDTLEDENENSDTLDSPIEETGTPDLAPSSPNGRNVGSRYPTRVRCPPLRYNPSDSRTFNFLVI